MELRDLAEQVLFATTLDEKLQAPAMVTDDRPGSPLLAPQAPGRPAELRFKPQGSGKADFPGAHRLEQEHERGSPAALLRQPRAARHRADGAGAPALSRCAHRLSSRGFSNAQGRAASHPALRAAHGAMRDSVRRAARERLLLARRVSDGESSGLRRQAVPDLRAGEPRLLPSLRSRI